MSASPPSPPPVPPPVVQTTQAGFTATCPQCRQPVHPKAYVCPYCRKRLRMSQTMQGCLIVTVVVLACVVVATMLRGCGSPPPAAPKSAWNPAAEAQLAAEHEKDFRVKEAAAAAANKEADAKEAAFLKTTAGKIWQKHKEWGRETCETIAKRQTIVGMTAEQVRLAWGKPDHVNSTITGNHRSEQWVYGSNQYVYFEDGIMTSLQQSK
jgi:hypothetical protein